MSIERVVKTILHCDMDNCLARQEFHSGSPTSRAIIERIARNRTGWRKDKLGRNVCPNHPKLKGTPR